MEFLNPEDKRARTIRLFVGYGLVALLIGLATLILVYLAQGYGYDPAKGVSRSGLVFLDAKPGPADIYIDSQQKGKTDLRISLGEGAHQVTLKKDKYRDWAKNINVDGGSVLYLIYPRLFPTEIPLGITQSYGTPPPLASQSPDRHWLVLQPTAGIATVTIFDLLKPTNESKTATIPVTQLISDKTGYGTLSVIEWSEDNRHLLLKQVLESGKEAYIVFDREDPSLTLNISAKLGLTGTVTVILRDKKFDKFYVHDPANGAIRIADTKTGIQAAPLVTGAVAFKTYADNLIMYVMYPVAKPTEATVMVLSNQTDTYTLQNVVRDPNGRYQLDIAKYDSNWYYVSSSSADKKVLLYRDPLAKAKPGNTTPITPRLALLLNSPQYVSFSDNARFIGMQSGKQFVVYDAELGRVYRYISPLAIADTQQAKWMDGHRYTVVADGKVQAFDFDGTNLQALTTSRPEFTGYFDRDYQYLYTLIQQTDGRTALQSGQIILN